MTARILLPSQADGSPPSSILQLVDRAFVISAFSFYHSCHPSPPTLERERGQSSVVSRSWKPKCRLHAGGRPPPPSLGRLWRRAVGLLGPPSMGRSSCPTPIWGVSFHADGCKEYRSPSTYRGCL